MLRMRGQGVHEDNGRKGDQFVLIELKVPENPGRYRELLEEMHKLESAEGGTPGDVGFFDKLKHLFG